MRKLLLLPLFLLGCSEQVEKLTPEELEEKRLREISDRKIDSLNRRIDSIKIANEHYQKKMRLKILNQ